MTLTPCTRIHFEPNAIHFQLVEELAWHIPRTGEPTPSIHGDLPDGLLDAQRAGPVWAWQKHLQERVVLHASALMRGGKAFCFAAPSGTGKSTLGAALRARGWQFLSDDLAAIRKGGVVERGPPHIRLWPDAAAWAGIEDMDVLMAGYDKLLTKLVPVQDEAPLGGVIVLERGEELGLARVAGADAMMALVAQTYVYQNYRGVVQWPPEPWHFQACAEMAKSVPVWKLTVPEGLEYVAEAAKLVSEHLSP